MVIVGFFVSARLFRSRILLAPSLSINFSLSCKMWPTRLFKLNELVSTCDLEVFGGNVFSPFHAQWRRHRFQLTTVYPAYYSVPVAAGTSGGFVNRKWPFNFVHANHYSTELGLDANKRVDYTICVS